jgi:hypothetical protein
MKHVTKVLLAFGLLLYAISMFLPWFTPFRLGCNTIYWSFKAEYYCTTNPPRYGEVMFFDYWSSCGIGTAFFVSQILTFLFGFLSLLKKVEGKYELMFLGLTLFFLAMPIGVIILQSCVFFDFYVSQPSFLAGFWIANIAFLLLIASLLISLIKYLR